MDKQITLGESLRTLRGSKKLTDIAKKADLTSAYLSDIEKNNRQPLATALYRILSALECADEERTTIIEIAKKARLSAAGY